LWKNYQIDW